ncbi:hypothetical protein EDC22_11151 [Tepidamorphus gemmatus]|jgi:hypothetical protein|uniref:FlgN protein n=1 Tax=Tepidamorphus gemmatus TaxID=747076 RepID=A0A4V2UY92_9HYPH|nr:hypothetical protein [Tepidamorphus gemmatus]TCT06468.1 hypothetical protein EDC22_11151 [Tepidamorphus gemmatus]
MTPVKTIVRDADTARNFCIDLSATVDALISVLEEETALVRSARLSAATALGSAKFEASERYLKSYPTLRDSAGEIARLAPNEIDHLRERHHALESALSHNLAVLATARTVSETLIRGIADIFEAEGAGPTVYGADGQHAPTPRRGTAFSCNLAL